MLALSHKMRVRVPPGYEIVVRRDEADASGDEVYAVQVVRKHDETCKVGLLRTLLKRFRGIQKSYGVKHGIGDSRFDEIFEKARPNLTAFFRQFHDAKPAPLLMRHILDATARTSRSSRRGAADCFWTRLPPRSVEKVRALALAVWSAN